MINMSISDNAKNIVSGVIDRIEEDQAVIELEGRDVLNIPCVYMPDGIAEGDVLKITFEHVLKEKTELEHNAKELLNDILGASKNPVHK